MIITANKEIRDAAKASGVRLWQIAAALGISDAHFSRKLRHELPADEQARILDVIADLSNKQVEAS